MLTKLCMTTESMKFLLVNFFLLVIVCLLNSAVGDNDHDSLRRHDDPYDDDKDSNDLSDHCIHIRMDHDTRLTDYLICPFGCCGTLDDQKCCDDPDKEKDEKEGNKHLVRGLLIFAAVMLVVALTCFVFGVYKHKKAKLRKTSPGKYETRTPVQRTSPYTTVFYTPRSGMKPTDDDVKKTRPSRISDPEIDAPVNDPSAPPMYSEKASSDTNNTSQSPPPPYSFVTPSVAPNSTNFA